MAHPQPENTAIADATATIVILGATTEALLTALHLSPRLVTLITPQPLDNAGPTGNIWPFITASTLDQSPKSAIFADLIASGEGLTNEAVAHFIANESHSSIQSLARFGLTMERLNNRDPATIWSTLAAAVRATPTITLCEGYDVDQLITVGEGPAKRAAGLYLSSEQDPAARHKLTNITAIVLATGGISDLYEGSSAQSNASSSASGLGIALAASAGAQIADAEFVHFPSTAPTACHHVGGIKTDSQGRTSISGLWAIGEVASTGLHGAAISPLGAFLETIVMSASCASDIATSLPQPKNARPGSVTRERTTHLADFGARSAGRAMIAETMTLNVGIKRDDASLRQALRTLSDIATAGAGDPIIDNTTLAARFIAEAALRRRESRGCHNRSDYPDTDPAQARSRTITRAGLDLRHSLASGELFSEITAAGGTLH